MTAADVNMLLEHYKVQVTELSRICGELTRMQHVNNKIIGVLERHIRDDVSNNNSDSKSILGELRDMLLLGDLLTSNTDLSGTDHSSPSDERTLSTVVERDKWSHAQDAPNTQKITNDTSEDQIASTSEYKCVSKQELSQHESEQPPRASSCASESSSSSRTFSNKPSNVSPQKRIESVSPTRGSAAYSVSPGRRNVSSLSTRNDEVASSFDEDAESNLPLAKATSVSEHAVKDNDSDLHVPEQTRDAFADRHKGGVISSAELYKLVDELSHASPKKKLPSAAPANLQRDVGSAKIEQPSEKQSDAELWQAYCAADYEAEADDDHDSDTAVTVTRPYTAPAPMMHEHGAVLFGPPSIIASLRAKYPDALVRQANARQRAGWIHDPLIQRAFFRLPSLVRGHLTRQLLQTDKVQQLKRLIRDSADIFAELYREIRERARIQTAVGAGRSHQQPAPPALTAEQKFLRDRILKQLRAALIDVNYTFHELSPLEQVRLIMQHHAAVYERERRARNSGFDDDAPIEDDLMSPRTVGFPRERLTPRLSSATLKKLEREARERSCSQQNVAPHSARIDGPHSNGQNGGALARNASRLTRTRSAGAMENRPQTAPVRDGLHMHSKSRNSNGFDSKPRAVLRNMQQTSNEKDRSGMYKAVAVPHFSSKMPPQSNAVTYGNGTYTKASAQSQRERDRSKSHNVVFEAAGRL